MATIKYDGKLLRISSAKDAHDAMQLAFRHLEGVRKDLANLAADHAQTAKLVQGGQQVTPMSMLSALPLPGRPAAPTAQSPATTPAPAVKSPHRTAVPTIDGVYPNVTIQNGATDRLFRLSVDFLNFAGGDTVVQVAWGAPYSAIPAVIAVQKGTEALVNLRPLAISTTGATFTADNVLGPVTVAFDLIVISPSVDNFD